MVRPLVGYALCRTDPADLAAERAGLVRLGVTPNQIFVDYGVSDSSPARPGLREAVAACRDGGTLVVTRLDRLARSLPDARRILDELSARGVSLNLAGSIHDPHSLGDARQFDESRLGAELDTEFARMRAREALELARSTRRRRAKLARR